MAKATAKKALAKKAPAKKAPAKKAPAKAGSLPKDFDAIYDRCRAKVFEVLFADDDALIAAFLKWAKENHSDWDAEIDADEPGLRAIMLETLIVDEEEEAAFVAFFATLPPKQMSAAVAAITALADETSPLDPARGNEE